MRRRLGITTAVLATAGLTATVLLLRGGLSKSAEEHRVFVDHFCVDCHNPIDRSGGLSLEGLDLAHVTEEALIWETVISKLRVGMMPPADAAQPPEEERQELVTFLETELDEAVRANPDPGPTLVRRLNRTEYGNAIRDLLDVEIDSTELLPPDNSAYGFDNNAESLSTSPLLVEQYLSAAGEIAALAVGDPGMGAVAQTFRVRQDASQNVHIAGTPVGMEGGGVFRIVLPLDGEYRLDVGYLTANLGAVKGLEMANEIEILVDDEPVHRATIGGAEDFAVLLRNITEAAEAVEKRSSISIPLPAGPHDIGVGFVYDGALQTSRRLQPFVRSTQDNLDFTGHPHIETLTVTGPFNASGPGDTPSRRRIFVCRPAGTNDAGESSESDCAREILSRLARRAYRGDATARDVDELMQFFEQGNAKRGFEGGIQTALERLLVSPKFVFRLEQDPEGMPPGTVYPVPDRELATRLSFFLWSSIPDDELLDLAGQGMLGKPDVLETQVRRMLTDAKADALVDSFAAQWLYLRNVESFVPNSVGFPNFDDNLRKGFQEETKLFFESIVRENRSVLDLMTADYTFLNERVAKHYGVPDVYGSHFRRVTLEDETRWGLLGKGSVLMVSSHTDRTSPVVRGKWVLENLLGTPPPAPPADVPALEEVAGENLTWRQRLELHRDNPVCAACHAGMDPIGFALENFDAVGAWREHEGGIDSAPINANGRLLDGTEVNGPVELRRALLNEPELFVSTVVKKLMIYGLGRGLTAHDMPVVRQIVRDTADKDYRFSEIVLAVIRSTPFRMQESSEYTRGQID